MLIHLIVVKDMIKIKYVIKPNFSHNNDNLKFHRKIHYVVGSAS
jgi:hypothetical protein